MSEAERRSLTLFVPCRAQPHSVSVDCEWLANPRDGSFAHAFSFGTVDASRLPALDAAVGALVLHCPFDLGNGRARALELIDALPEALAVRVEQSKLGWERDTWLGLIASDDARVRHRAVVTLLGDDVALQSCGMHAFGLPDAHVAVDGSDALAELVTTFNAYQIAEDPMMLTGQTFSCDAGAPQRVITRWPDAAYPPTSPCHNPYGVWRLGAPGSRGQGAPALTSVFMPPLVTLLTALETKNGAPLTRAQVEATRDSGVCMAMAHADARALERSRGYADLEPELVWEQWLIARHSS